MRSRPVFVLASGLLASAMLLSTPAGAAPPRSRVVTATYLGAGVDSPADPVPAMYGDASGQGGEVEAVTVTTTRNDRTVSLRLVDQDGLPVLAAVVQHLGPDSRSDEELGRVCGSSTRPLRLVAPGKSLTVYLLAGRCPAGPSVPTSGTLTLTVTR
jgi:hypothetical protein